MDIRITGDHILVIEKKVAHREQAKNDQNGIGPPDPPSPGLFREGTGGKDQDQGEKEVNGPMEKGLRGPEAPCIEMVERHRQGNEGDELGAKRGKLTSHHPSHNAPLSLKYSSAPG